MNSKGFTLVELLAVIVILAIILSIAVPTITNIIDNSNQEAYVSNEKMIVKAAKTYIAGNNVELPNTIGDTLEIKISTLQSAGYLNPIKDPKNSSISCDGYLLITKIDAANYDYTPYLKCGDGLVANGYSTDGLVGNWKMDNVEEATYNYLKDDFDVTFESFALGSDAGFLNQLGAGSTLQVSNERSYSGTKSLKVISLGSNLRTYRTKNVLLNDYVTFSAWVYSTQPGPYLKIELQGGSYNWTGAISTAHTGSGWERLSVTYPSKLTSNTTCYYFLYAPNPGSVTYWDDIQIEKKDHVTPFANGSRTSYAYDYTPNNNHGTVTEALKTTNRFNASNSALLFDGVNDIVDLGNSSTLNFGTSDFTISFWTYRTASGVAGGTYINKCNQCHLTTQPGFETYDNNFVVNTSTGRLASISINASMNTWEHHTIVVSQNSSPYIKHYINGMLNQSGYNEVGNKGSINNAQNLIVGYSNAGGVARYYNGSMDDLKIYNRALSASEIKFNYDIEKKVSE